MKRLALILAIGLGLPESASAVEWFVHRSVDTMTDRAKCEVGTYDQGAPDLMAYVWDGKLWFTVVGGRSYPGASSAIRVDANQAFVFKDRVSGDDALQLLDQLEKGERVRTRFTHWPDAGKVEHEGPVGDFAAKVRSCLNPAPAEG